MLSLDDDNTDSGGNSFGSSAPVGATLSADQQATLASNVKKAVMVRGLQSKSPLLNGDLLNISVAHDYRAHQGRVMLTLLNKSSFDIQNLSALLPSDDAFSFKQQGLSSRLSPGEETVLQISADCMKPFVDQPILELRFSVQGSSYSYKIPLPISISCYCEPLAMDKTTYMNRWKAITAEGTENQVVFASGVTVDTNLVTNIRNIFFSKAKIGLADGLDNDKTATGGCSFLTGTATADGSRIVVGVLLRLEADPVNNKFRVTVRATNPKVSAAMKDFIVSQMS